MEKMRASVHMFSTETIIFFFIFYSWWIGEKQVLLSITFYVIFLENILVMKLRRKNF